MELIAVDVEPAGGEALTPWIGGATTYLAVWGEYERTGADWSFTKKVRESMRQRRGYWDVGRTIRVEAKLKVHGVQRKGRYLPRRWGMWLEFGCHRLSVNPAPGDTKTCRSLAEAMRRADRALEAPHGDHANPVEAIVATAYGRSFVTRSVYRLKDSAPRHKPSRHWPAQVTEEVLADPSNWEPFLTDFRVAHSDIVEHLSEHGIWILEIYRHGSELRARVVHKQGSGHSGSGRCAYNEMIQGMEHWA